MSKRIAKWLAQRPRLYSWVALPLFPALAASMVVADTWPEVRDLAEESVSNTKRGWRALIIAYKEWPQNVYKACEENRNYYAKRGEQE